MAVSVEAAADLRLGRQPQLVASLGEPALVGGHAVLVALQADLLLERPHQHREEQRRQHSHVSERPGPAAGSLDILLTG